MKYQNILAGWIKETKKGDKYISLKAERDIKEGEMIALYKNDKGDNPKRPDYRAYEKLEDKLEDEIPF